MNSNEQISKSVQDITKPIELPEIPMHGPIECSMKIYFTLPTGETANINVFFEPGVIPSASIIKIMLDEALAEVDGVPEGTRLMTKPEFVKHITTREAGFPMEVPGNQEFEPLDTVLPPAVDKEG